MKLSLVVQTAGPQQNKVLEIKMSQFIIGRDPECHLRPASSLISKRHCALIQRDGKVFLRDFDSTNGTFRNNEPVKGEVELQQDDQLKVGPLEFLVKLEETSASSTPVPAAKVTEDKTVALGDKTVATRPAAKKPAAPAVPAKPVAAKGKPATESQPTSATKSDAKAGAEDDIAAMLLSMGDDSSPGEPGPSVPEGDTLLDLKTAGTTEQPAADQDKEKDKADDKAKKAAEMKGNTANAAKAILDKMMRRPRT
jgi:pSer/pThr/pTyr-binding forkhead associated (FHA) protein